MDTCHKIYNTLYRHVLQIVNVKVFKEFDTTVTGIDTLYVSILFIRMGYLYRTDT